MSAIVRWLLLALLSALAGQAAKWFEGACPLDAGSWVCTNWGLVVAVATFVLGLFGVRVQRQRLAAVKSQRKVDPKPEPVTTTATVPGEVVYTTATGWGENVTEGGISDDDRPPG